MITSQNGRPGAFPSLKMLDDLNGAKPTLRIPRCNRYQPAKVHPEIAIATWIEQAPGEVDRPQLALPA